jgi:hypothetical protein
LISLEFEENEKRKASPEFVDTNKKRIAGEIEQG